MLQRVQPLTLLFARRVLLERRLESHLRIIGKFLHRFIQQSPLAGGAIGGEKAGRTALILFEVRLNLPGSQLGRLVSAKNPDFV